MPLYIISKEEVNLSALLASFSKTLYSNKPLCFFQGERGFIGYPGPKVWCRPWTKCSFSKQCLCDLRTCADLELHFLFFPTQGGPGDRGSAGGPGPKGNRGRRVSLWHIFPPVPKWPERFALLPHLLTCAPASPPADTHGEGFSVLFLGKRWRSWDTWPERRDWIPWAICKCSFYCGWSLWLFPGRASLAASLRNTVVPVGTRSWKSCLLLSTANCTWAKVLFTLCAT